MYVKSHTCPPPPPPPQGTFTNMHLILFKDMFLLYSYKMIKPIKTKSTGIPTTLHLVESSKKHLKVTVYLQGVASVTALT